MVFVREGQWEVIGTASHTHTQTHKSQTRTPGRSFEWVTARQTWSEKEIFFQTCLAYPVLKRDYLLNIKN